MRARKPRLFAATLGIVIAVATAVTATPASAVASADDAVVTLNNGTNIGALDTATGATSALSGPGHSGLYGDAFSTDGNLYGLENGQLVLIDQTTGAATAIGSNQGLYYGLDQAPDGTMYAASYGGPNGAGLYQINTATGAVTFVGSARGAMDVTFDCSGTLWGTDGGQIFSYDLATGAITNTVTLTGFANAGSIMGLFVDDAGDMLATSYETPTGKLFKVDPSTGALTLIGSTSGASPHGGDDANACGGLAQQTTVGSVAGTSTFGQAATLTATLTAAGSGVPDENVAFSLNGTPVGTATTDSNGVATLGGVDTTGIDAGSYTGAVTATFTGDGSYATSGGTGDLTVAPAAQAVSFTTTPPTVTVGDSYAAAATGGPSGQPVTFSADPSTTNSACTVATDGTVTFQHSGVCVIDADQAGNVDYTAAPTAQQNVPVGAAATTLTVAVSPNAVTATVTAVNPAAGTPTGTVEFSVNGGVVGTSPARPERLRHTRLHGPHRRCWARRCRLPRQRRLHRFGRLDQPHQPDDHHHRDQHPAKDGQRLVFRPGHRLVHLRRRVRPAHLAMPGPGHPDQQRRRPVRHPDHHHDRRRRCRRDRHRHQHRPHPAERARDRSAERRRVPRHPAPPGLCRR